MRMFDIAADGYRQVFARSPFAPMLSRPNPVRRTGYDIPVTVTRVRKQAPDVVSFELTPISAGTRVDVVHTDLPSSEVPGHATGWEHFLPRLARAAAGEHLPPDTWKPTP